MIFENKLKSHHSAWMLESCFSDVHLARNYKVAIVIVFFLVSSIRNTKIIEK